jgi:hypothetical protein
MLEALEGANKRVDAADKMIASLKVHGPALQCLPYRGPIQGVCPQPCLSRCAAASSATPS